MEREIIASKGYFKEFFNVTQAELARRIGSDRSYISRVESGQTEPKVSTFYRIMNALGCKIEFSKIL